MLHDNNINEELEKAVHENNLMEVKALLSAGANPNFLPRKQSSSEYGNTLLHYVKSVEVAKELLLNGAWVDARNDYRETPLHTAIPYRWTAKLVRELLKHGANVNAEDRKGNTPLNRAVKTSIKNLEVIRELLEYGADINRKNRERRISEDHSSPLDNAARMYPECAEILIKISLIKHFDKNYRNIINLDPYKGVSCYSKLSSHLEDCVCELTRMKTDIIHNNLSLYEIITTKESNKEVMKEEDMDVILHIYSCYPKYCDIISGKIDMSLERASLLNKLSESEVYTKSDASNHAHDVKQKNIVLDSDSKQEVAQYLSNNDLLHLLAAFYENADEPSSLERNFAESSTDQTLREASTSNYTKRTKLE